VVALKPSSRALVYFSGALASFVPDFIINCSNQSAKLHSKFGYDRPTGAVIHNGYDPAEFRPDEGRRAFARRQLGVAAGEFVIGSISRWHPHKDIENLLRGLRLAHDRGVPIRSYLIGHGLDEDNVALKRLLADSGCEALVTLLGARSDIPDLARAMDIHVLASMAEAFPNVVAETMLSGTPNIVTDVGDCALMVADAGWVVPSRSPQKLADAIVEAFRRKANPVAWEELRTEARARIAENFTDKRMAEGYLEVWHHLARVDQAK
jgi:glycosyltransferase involved in cell wall biosynthesis